MKRLGVARAIQRSSYKPWRVARAIRAMLAEPEYEQKAQIAARQIEKEDGVKTACDALIGLCEQTRALR
jgi:UDP:flavonoid glycosyltransferase YjiC (YdhE family)